MIGGGFLLAAVGLLVLVVGRLLLTGSSNESARPDGGYLPGTESGHETDDKRTGVVRWLTTVDHKDIGLMYLTFGTVAALWGGLDSMMMRTELLTPVADVWAEETYNALFTTHGTTMLFLFVTPVFFGITNYFLPLFVGADDLAFPRVNAIAFWLLPPSLLLIRGGITSEIVAKLLGLVVPPESLQLLYTLAPPAIGWTMYTPLTTTMANPQIDFFLLGLHLSGISTTMGALNFIVTVFMERAEDVSIPDLSVFTWSMLTVSSIILFAFPLLGSVIVMLLLDRNLGTHFFTTQGSPILYQHLFWFFGHPEVYVIFLPSTGLMSTILPKFSGRKLFGRAFVIYSTLAIGVMSFGVWGHHMFTTGIDPRVLLSFMAVSIAIAIPSAIKVFNWLTTMWKGDITLTAPMILSVSGVGTFIVGGITGVFLGVIPIDILYQDTYYVVGHFHLILMGIIPFSMLAASYYWYPIITGRMYDQRLAKVQSTLFVSGSTVTFGTMVVMGALGMPRRFASYPAKYAPYHQLISLGAFVIGVSVVMWLYNMVQSARMGPVVRDADVWGLKRTSQFTREWRWFEERLEEQYGIEPTEPAERRRSRAEFDSTREGAPTAPEDVRGFVGATLVGAAAGAVGTACMTLVLLAGVALGVFDPVAFADLADLAGFGRSVPIGYAVFAAGGVLVWPLLFGAVAEKLPGAPRVQTGLTGSTIIWVGFLQAFYTGQAGLALAGYFVVTLLAHWAYGITLSVLAEIGADRFDIGV